jgi:hypothetical protein
MPAQQTQFRIRLLTVTLLHCSLALSPTSDSVLTTSGGLQIPNPVVTTDGKTTREAEFYPHSLILTSLELFITDGGDQ